MLICLFYLYEEHFRHQNTTLRYHHTLFMKVRTDLLAIRPEKNNFSTGFMLFVPDLNHPAGQTAYNHEEEIFVSAFPVSLASKQTDGNMKSGWCSESGQPLCRCSRGWALQAAPWAPAASLPMGCSLALSYSRCSPEMLQDSSSWRTEKPLSTCLCIKNIL